MQPSREEGAQGQSDLVDNITQEAFQCGYSRTNEFPSSSVQRRGYENGKDSGSNRIQSLETVLSSRTQPCAPFNSWAPDISNGDQCSSSSLGQSHYWTSPHSVPTRDVHRAPLDGHSSPISSPVSSTEECIKANLRQYAGLDVPWMQHASAQSNQTQFNSALDGIQMSKGEWLREGEKEMTAPYEHNSRNVLDASSGITTSRTMQPSYSTGQLSNIVPNNLWSDISRRSFDAETAYEGQVRSPITAQSANRLSHPALYAANDTSHLFKSFLPDQQALRLPPLTAFPSDTGAEYSIFVGDLSPELREEDLVAQFLQPSAWPASHPFAIAHAHAQQAKGAYGTPLKIRPAPFTSTKSAKVSWRYY